MKKPNQTNRIMAKGKQWRGALKDEKKKKEEPENIHEGEWDQTLVSQDGVRADIDG